MQLTQFCHLCETITYNRQHINSDLIRAKFLHRWRHWLAFKCWSGFAVGLCETQPPWKLECKAVRREGCTGNPFMWTFGDLIQCEIRYRTLRVSLNLRVQCRSSGVRDIRIPAPRGIPSPGGLTRLCHVHYYDDHWSRLSLTVAYDLHVYEPWRQQLQDHGNMPDMSKQVLIVCDHPWDRQCLESGASLC